VSTSATPSAAPPFAKGRLHVLAILLLLGLLLILSLRLTMTESLYQAYQQVSAMFGARLHPPGDVIAPEIGPAVTLGLSAVTLVLAAIVAGVATAARAITSGKMLRFCLIAAILGLGMFSTLQADNRFAALVGLCDIAGALVGAWAVGLLCHPTLLGSAGRRIVTAALISVLAVWIAKGLYQRAVEIPDTIDYYTHHREESLAAQGMSPNDPGVRLYEARMMSKEVAGYVTLSNVMGAGMIGLLAALAGILAARMAGTVEEVADPTTAARKRDKSKSAAASVEIPVTSLLLFFAVLLLPLGLITLFLTQSRGGSILAVVCIVAIFLGGYYWTRIVTHRRMIVAGSLLFLAIAAAGVLAFGITHDRLPSKSLMFRWHYWTASASLIKRFPITGVGLNNFGDYYASVKRLSSPETVQDPHSFFVRLASEMGLPAAILIGLLIFWSALSATRVPAEPDVPASPEQSRRLQQLAILFCPLWWLLHLLIAETSEAYSVILSFLAAVIAFAGWSIAAGLLSRLNARGLRVITIALLLGAMGMFVYDQINMALVTGPVAMLFWFMLAAADSYDAPAQRPGLLKPFGFAAAVVLFAAAVCIAVLAWMPALNGTMPWDARPWIDRYITAASLPPQDFTAARTSLTEAIARDPRSVALRRQMMLLKERLHEPVDEDAREILALDHADMHLRLNIATENSSLPLPERIRILKDVLYLDDQLPTDEVTRLSGKERSEVQAMIKQVESATVPATAPRAK